MAEQAARRDSRRRLLTGGAVLLGAAAVGAPGTAEAANGQPLLIGRLNSGSAETKLTNSSTVAGLNVTSTNSAGGARAASFVANGGYGAHIQSATNHAASIWTKHRDRWSAFAVNDATTRGGGGAIRADGRQNHGVSAGTANPLTTAITARNTAGGDVFTRRAIVATADPAGQAMLDAVADWRSAGEFAGVNGLIGLATRTYGYGVVGRGTQPHAIGVVAQGPANDGYALYAWGRVGVSGDMTVSGTLTKSAGSFRIDHPLDPANKYLSHSFVESPDMMNVYNGNVTTDANGEAIVELPEWFEALNKDFRYQLTAIGPGAPDLHVKSKVANGHFSIGGAKPGQEVSWQLTGIRHDAYAEAHRIPVEHAKPPQEKGSYLFPEGFDKPRTAGLATRTASAQQR